jgi:hypothetical protein
MDMAGCSSLLPPIWHLRCLKLPRVLFIMDMQVWERWPMLHRWCRSNLLLLLWLM